MTKKALIVYGTRFGATTSTAEEIASVLRNEGLEVIVVNAKKEKVRDISHYDLVIVGSGMMMNRWTGEPEKFLSKFQKELKEKKLAIFVSSGGQALIDKEKDAAEIERTKKQYLDDKAAKYNLQPVALGMFGGVWDFNKMPWWSKKALIAIKPKLEEAGIKETSPGAYDTRDWNTIREWAKELARKL